MYELIYKAKIASSHCAYRNSLAVPLSSATLLKLTHIVTPYAGQVLFRGEQSCQGGRSLDIAKLSRVRNPVAKLDFSLKLINKCYLCITHIICINSQPNG